MKIQIVSVSHKDPPWLEESISIYQQRLPRDWRLEFIALKPKIASSSSRTPNQIKEEEWMRVKAKLAPNTGIIALDERGKQWSSPDFAAQLRIWQEAKQTLAFVIGGAEGLSDLCRTEAYAMMSLSSLTFPHQFVKLMLVEQLYRAFTIQSGHPYHKV